jgi:hypothetical protein
MSEASSTKTKQAGEDRALPTDIYISRHKTYLSAWDDEIPGHGSKLLEVYNAWRAASAVLEKWRVKDAEINGNSQLTDEGKWAAKRSALADSENRLSRSLEVVLREADDLERREMELKRSAEGSSSDASAEIRAGEIRSWYARLDKEEQLRMLREALDSDDREVLSSLLSAPRAFRLIPEQLQAHIVDTLVKRRAPEKAAALEPKRRAVRTAKLALDRAVRVWETVPFDYMKNVTSGQSQRRPVGDPTLRISARAMLSPRT